MVERRAMGLVQPYLVVWRHVFLAFLYGCVHRCSVVLVFSSVVVGVCERDNFCQGFSWVRRAVRCGMNRRCRLSSLHEQRTRPVSCYAGGPFAVSPWSRHGGDWVRSPEGEMGQYLRSPPRFEVRIVTLRQDLRDSCGHCIGNTSAVYTG